LPASKGRLGNESREPSLRRSDPRSHPPDASKSGSRHGDRVVCVCQSPHESNPPFFARVDSTRMRSGVSCSAHRRPSATVLATRHAHALPLQHGPRGARKDSLSSTIRQRKTPSDSMPVGWRAHCSQPESANPASRWRNYSKLSGETARSHDHGRPRARNRRLLKLRHFASSA